MADNTNIQNALAGFAQKIESGEVEAVDSQTVVANGAVVSESTPDRANTTSEEENVFDDAVIAGLDDSGNDTATDIHERWERLLREQMADMASKDPNQFNDQRSQLVNDMIAYKKELMIKHGFSSEEADEAAINRLKKKAVNLNTEFIKNNPNLAVIKIDKSQSDNLEFSEEEKKKIVKTKAIRLIEVEDQALKSIKIKSAPDPDSLFKAIHRVSCNLSKYSMPVLNTFDMCEFSGATTTQLVQAVYNENDNMYRKYQEQLELVYAKFMGSTTIDKYDINGDTIFTKDDFAGWFKFHDLPTAMFSIYVASSTEEITSTFVCSEEDGGCGEQYNFTYNTKTLITYKDIPDPFKEDLDLILSNENDRQTMLKIKDEKRLTKRFQSPYTNNIYDISAPSVSRALSILRYVRPGDTYAQYLSMYAMMLESILVFDPSDNQYYKIDYNTPLDIMRFMYDINDTEIKLVTKMIDKFTYVPSFEITTRCEHCKKERTSEFSIDELVFLKAQNIGAEIE